ncbi:MAG TPA: Panacea domain-containing protein [Candidatus Acidoferrales bacterium]|nr:Panacea domain-containing protein [Candidatus Acidoferrales bacterium]
MYNLTFEFSLEKLVQAIAYFSKAGVPDLTKLKIAKLLYFADKEHLLEYGRPIIGDVYWCMDWGPVPSFALNEMNEAIDRQEVPLGTNSDARLFTRVLNVKKLFYFHPRFEAKDEAYNPAVFSESELRSLGNVANSYGNRSAKELVNITHQEPTWTIPNQGRPAGSRAPITYDLFFVGAPEKSQRFLARLVAEQFGVAIPLKGDADYAAFAGELASYDFTSDEVGESETRRAGRYSRA